MRKYSDLACCTWGRMRTKEKEEDKKKRKTNKKKEEDEKKMKCIGDTT